MGGPSGGMIGIVKKNQVIDEHSNWHYYLDDSNYVYDAGEED